MELKIEKWPMLNSGRIVRLTRTRSIRCYECGEERGCLVIYGLVASFKGEKRKVNVGDAWFRVLSLSLSVCLSVCLSLTQLEFWSAECRLPSLDLAPLSRNLSFYIVFLFWSDQIVFFCFLQRRSRIGQKIIFNYFYFFFFTNFIDVSLCADPMRRNLFFPFWRKSQH